MTINYNHYMTIALRQAEEALGKGEFPVGCVIVCGDAVVATGVRQNSSEALLNEIDHAEIIALREFSGKSGPADKTEAVLFCTLEPCLMCYAAIMLSGIRTIVYAYEDVMGGGTSVDLSGLAPLYSKADMAIVPDVMRTGSLHLFIRFFENPENRYWSNSLLEKYTLSQKNI